MPLEMNRRFMDVIKDDEQLQFLQKFGERADIHSLQFYMKNSRLGEVALKGKNYELIGLVDVSSSFIKVAVRKILSLMNPFSSFDNHVFQTFRFDDYSVTIRYMDSKTPFYMMSVKR